MNDFDLRFPLVDVAEKTVIRADKKMLTRLDRDPAPRRTDTGIYDCQMNGPQRKIVIAGAECECRRSDLLRRDLVSDVDDPDLRINRQDDTFDGWYKIIASAEIGEQGDHNKETPGCGDSGTRGKRYPVK